MVIVERVNLNNSDYSLPLSPINFKFWFNVNFAPNIAREIYIK